ncbi:hypothetical protein ACI3PL_14375, partial [Lacticaseibacillus paracasei]
MITNKGKKLLRDLKFYESYSKYKEELQRKETWEESVLDVMQMHRNKFQHIESGYLANYLDIIEEDYTKGLILAS